MLVHLVGMLRKLMDRQNISAIDGGVAFAKQFADSMEDVVRVPSSLVIVITNSWDLA